MEAERREDLIERFVRGISSEEERLEVEKLLVEDHDFKKDLETQQVVYDSLKVLAEKERLASTFSFKEEARVVPLNSRKWITYAAAASFILIALTFSWIFLREEEQTRFAQVPVFQFDSSLGFVKPETSPLDSTVVAVYSSKEHSGSYSFVQDTLKLYVSRPDFALDLLLLYDEETSRYTLDVGGRRFLIEESSSEKKLKLLVNER